MKLILVYCSYRQYQRYLMRDRPSDLTDIVTEQDFKKAQAYNLDKSRFGFIDGLYRQIETILMLHYNVLPYFWSLAGQILYKVSGYGSEYEVKQHIL